MLKIAAAGVTALLFTVSPLVCAETPSQQPEPLGATSALTDARINIIKSVLQLTPEQEKYWPAIEDSIRARAKDRQARIATAAARVAELRDRDPVEVLRERNAVDFMERRAEALAQRSADLKRLADAWRPLYQTLSPDQKRRMAYLTIFTVREMRNAVEQRRLQTGGEDGDFAD